LAEKFGITDAWVKFNSTQRAVGLKKRISKNLDVGYEIEEEITPGVPRDPQQPRKYNQKVLGDLRVSKSISVIAEKAIQNRQSLDVPEPVKAVPDDSIFLQYKKSF
jgi:hypothetical protein